MYELWLKHVVIVTVELGLHCLIVKISPETAISAVFVNAMGNRTERRLVGWRLTRRARQCVCLRKP